MADNVVINLEVNAAGAVQNIDAVEAAIVETSEATQSLKAQLRALQVEMQDLDPNSARFQELSKQAGQLKDTINDTAEAIKNNAGNAFEGLSNNAQTLGSRLLSMDFSGVGNSAKAMAGNVKNINLKLVTEEIGGMVKGFASLGKALLANPIFLIGAAVAAIIMNFNELKGLVDGVSSAQKESLALAKENANAAQRELDLIGQSENILREQGKSEREILEMKIARTQAVIDEQKVVIAGLESIQESQIAAAQRNKGFLVGIMNFISAPLRTLLMTIDGIGDSLVKLGVLEKGFGLAKMLDEGINFLANQVFNPEETRKKGEADIQAAKDKLLGLENQLSGHRQAIKNIDKKARDEANAAAQKQAEKEKEAADKKAAQEKKDAEERLARQERERKAQEEADKNRLDAEEAISEQIYQASLSAQDKELQALRDGYFEKIQLANQYGLDATALVNEQAAKEAEINKKYQDEAAAKQKEIDDKKLADIKKRQEDTVQLAANGFQTLSALTDAFEGQSKKAQEKAFKVRKAASIAQTLISTYQGAMQAYNSQIVPLDPSSVVRGAIAAAFVVATGLANVKKIASQKFDGGGATGGGSPGGAPSLGGGGSMAGGTPTFNPVDMSFINNRPAQGAQTYVLAGSVSNAQDANAKIQDLRRL
jgi:uncharacterized coiled-coil protein SlyX